MKIIDMTPNILEIKPIAEEYLERKAFEKNEKRRRREFAAQMGILVLCWLVIIWKLLP